MNNFTEDDIKRTGLPEDVFGLLHDLCYHVNNKLRGNLDEGAIQNYVRRAQEILKSPSKSSLPSVKDVESMAISMNGGSCLCGHSEFCENCSQSDSAIRKRKDKYTAVRLAEAFLGRKVSL